MLRRAVIALLLLLPALLFAQGGVQGVVPSGDVSRNPDLAGVGVDFNIGATIPKGIVLTDDHGQRKAIGQLFKGRPVVLLPIFYRCVGVCTTEMQGVLNALAKNPGLVPGRDLDIVGLDLNPKETPELAAAKKAEYLDQYHEGIGNREKGTGGDGWTFLTGPQSEVQKVATGIGFKYTYDAERDRVNHPSSVYVITPSGKVSAIMVEGMYPSARFAEDVRRAAKDELGDPPADTAWLGCVHVDPVTGKRSIMVMGIARLLGIATILGILATIVFQSRRKGGPTAAT
jgi:protein SCO1/2